MLPFRSERVQKTKHSIYSMEICRLLEVVFFSVELDLRHGRWSATITCDPVLQLHGRSAGRGPGFPTLFFHLGVEKGFKATSLLKLSAFFMSHNLGVAAAR